MTIKGEVTFKNDYSDYFLMYQEGSITHETLTELINEYI
jgi:hypothetical protein